MSETKWALGPWEVSDCLCRGISHKYREISSRAETFWIAQVLSFDSTEATPEPEAYRANARLIAAAPDLYEALALLLRVHERAVRNGLSRDLYDSDAEYETAIGENISIKASRAALAKARGESA